MTRRWEHRAGRRSSGVSTREVMPMGRAHVMLSAMRPALPSLPSSKPARLVIRLVQVAMVAYGVREAIRFRRRPKP